MRVVATAVATYAALSLSLATRAIVEVGTLTEVTVDAPLYDPHLSNNNGCDPAGCVGDLTRVSLFTLYCCRVLGINISVLRKFSNLNRAAGYR